MARIIEYQKQGFSISPFLSEVRREKRKNNPENNKKFLKTDPEHARVQLKKKENMVIKYGSN